MKAVKYLCTALALATLSAPALADECSHYSSSYDRTFCMSKLFVESDKELNSVYKNLSAAVKGNTRQILLRSQREWLAYRNSHCESNPGRIDVDCSYRTNQARVEFLRDRLRECKTGNCRADAIGEKSW
jgi:hypothetical protein